MRTFVMGCLALFAAACISPFGTGERRFTGVYVEGREVMVFEPAGTDQSWAAVGQTSSLRAALPPGVDPEPGFRVCATIMGRVSPIGRYGHLGLFSREIEITRVIEAHPEPCN